MFFSYSFFTCDSRDCTAQLFPTFEHDNSQRINVIIGSDMRSVTLAYEVIAIFGYLAFGQDARRPLPNQHAELTVSGVWLRVTCDLHLKYTQLGFHESGVIGPCCCCSVYGWGWTVLIRYIMRR